MKKLGYNSHNDCTDSQEHVHEIQGTVQIAEEQCDAHNHRFTTVSGEAIQCGMSHFHKVKFRTDNREDHFHEFTGDTSLAIKVGDRHVHFIEDATTVSDGHQHCFRVGTLINDPIGREK